MLLLIDCKDYMLLSQSLATNGGGGGAEIDKRKEVRVSIPPRMQPQWEVVSLRSLSRTRTNDQVAIERWSY